MGITSNSPGDGDDYRPLAEINITPMVDVMLVLLIIFMVAAPLMVQGVPLDLPRTTATRLLDAKRATVVSLVGTNQIEVRSGDLSQTFDRSNKAERLAGLRASVGDGIVYVRADRSARYGEVMDVLGRLGDAGFSKISLLSQPRPAAGSGDAP